MRRTTSLSKTGPLDPSFGSLAEITVDVDLQIPALQEDKQDNGEDERV